MIYLYRRFALIMGMFDEKNGTRLALTFIALYALFMIGTRDGGAISNFFNPQIFSYQIIEPSGITYEATIRFQGEGKYVENGDEENGVAFQIIPQHATNLRHTLEEISFQSASDLDETETVVSIFYRGWDQPVLFNAGDLPQPLDAIAENIEQILDTAEVRPRKNN